MKSKERVYRALEFNNPDRVPLYVLHVPNGDLMEFLKIILKYKSDIGMAAFRLGYENLGENKRKDAWGAIWRYEGQNKGEVVVSPLKEWSELDTLTAPNYFNRKSLFVVKLAKKLYSKKFMIGGLPDMIFSRMHYLRGFVPFMEDLYFEQDNLKRLASIITTNNIQLIKKYAELGYDAVMGADDFGLQERLMISPDMWREFIKPYYKIMVDEAKKLNLKFILHSCGYIMEIIEDLIEIGVDALQLDQQDNMGIDVLQERFGGRIAFFSPIDIQSTLSTNDEAKIRAKGKELITKLGKGGGFIGKTYPTPKPIGVSEKSVRIMLESFLDK